MGLVGLLELLVIILAALASTAWSTPSTIKWVARGKSQTQPRSTTPGRQAAMTRRESTTHSKRTIGKVVLGLLPILIARPKKQAMPAAVAPVVRWSRSLT